jgi:hypothetical protein
MIDQRGGRRGDREDEGICAIIATSRLLLVRDVVVSVQQCCLPQSIVVGRRFRSPFNVDCSRV